MGDKRRIRSVPVHAGRRAVDEQAARRDLNRHRTALAAALATFLIVTPAAADPPAAPAPAAPASAPAAPAAPAAAAAPGVGPFGPGTPITVVTNRAVQVGVAPVAPDGTPPSDYDFKRVAVAPASFQLPPGHYVLTVEDDGVTSEDIDLVVGAQPVHLQVTTGSSDMATLGALTLGIGTLCVLSGLAILISGSKAPSSLDKTKVEVPLLAAGGVLVGGGIGLYFASRTKIERNPPGAAPARPRGFVAGVRVAF